MRTVALPAIRPVNRVSSVSFLERGLRLVMTRYAQGNRLIAQKVRLVGAVRSMADQTSLGLRSLVNDCFLKRLPLMALKAYLASFCLEQARRGGRMGVMALNAFSPGQSAVHRGLIQAHFRLIVA